MTTKVSIDNEEFKSMNDAANFLEIPAWQLSATLNHKPSCNINGFDVKKLTKGRQCFKIICIDTQEVFNTMKDLAEHLNVNHSMLCHALNKNTYFYHNGKRYAKLSEKSEITKGHTVKGPCLKHNPLIVDGEQMTSNKKENAMNAKSTPTNHQHNEEDTEELIEMAKKETAEQVIQRLTVDFISKKDYDTAEKLLTVLKKYGKELNK